MKTVQISFNEIVQSHETRALSSKQTSSPNSIWHYKTQNSHDDNNWIQHSEAERARNAHTWSVLSNKRILLLNRKAETRFRFVNNARPFQLTIIRFESLRIRDKSRSGDACLLGFAVEIVDLGKSLILLSQKVIFFLRIF